MSRTVALVVILASLGFATSTLAQQSYCIEIWDPVCGVNGETYANSCFATQAGVAIAYTGECIICGGIAGIECPSGFLCDLPAGQCTVADLLGVCMPEPGEGCPEIYRPVCGCDKKTYGNDCERLKAGVQKDHNGKCVKKKPLITKPKG